MNKDEINLLNKLESNDKNIILEVVRTLRKKLKDNEDNEVLLTQIIQQFNDYGFTTILIRLLESSTLNNNLNIELKEEICSTLSNVSSGSTSQNRYLVSIGIVPILIQMIKLNSIQINLNIVGYCIYSLANIVKGDTQLRDLILDTEIIYLINIILINNNYFQDIIHFDNNESESSPSIKFKYLLLENISYFYHTICKTMPPFYKISNILESFKIIFNLCNQYDQDEQMLNNLLYTILNLTLYETENISTLFTVELFDKIIELTYHHENEKIKNLALRFIANFSYHSDEVEDIKIYKRYKGFLSNLCSNLPTESTIEIYCLYYSIKTITNIADYGDYEQIQAIIDHNIVDRINSILKQGEEHRISATDNSTIYNATTAGLKREFICSISTIINNSNFNQILYIIRLGAIKHLSNFLSEVDLYLNSNYLYTNNSSLNTPTIQQTLEIILQSIIYIFESAHSIHHHHSKIGLSIAIIMNENNIFKNFKNFINSNNNHFNTDEINTCISEIKEIINHYSPLI